MKLAISNIAWEKIDDFKVYNLMKKYNFIGLEIAPTRFFPENPYDIDKNTLSILKENIKKENLKIISMQSILYGKNNLEVFKSEEIRQELLEYLKKGIVFASTLGIKNIVFGNPKNRISYSEKDNEIALEFFKKLGEFSEKYGVTIGIEPNPKIYGGNFLVSTKETIEFVKKCNNKNIGLNLDLGTMIENKEDIEILMNIPIEKISHIHISEPYLETISIDNIGLHLELFEFLKRKNYKNFVSIEMKKSEDDNIDRIERTLKYILQLKDEVFYE